MKRFLFISVTLSLIVCLLPVSAICSKVQDKPEADKTGEVSLPWDEFQKILRLGTDEIVLEFSEFSALLRQTKVKKLPSFIVKEGSVVLKRDEFKKLLKSMKAHYETHVLGDYLVTRAVYQANAEEETTLVNAEFSIEILQRQDNKKYVVIPLLRQEVALKNAFLNGTEALVTTKNGQHAVAISEPGTHKVNLSFNVQTDLKRGPQTINFPIPQTPITLLSLKIPIPSIKPEVASARAIRRKSGDKFTEVEAVLSPTHRIQITWSRIIPEKEKGPAKIYADLNQLLSIEDDALRVGTTMNFNIFQNTINTLSLRIPAGYQVLNVSGASVGDWKEKEIEERNILVLSLKTAKQGKMQVFVQAEKILPDQNAVADFNGFEVLGAVREKGFLGVELKSSAEVKVTEAKGLDRVAFPELPGDLVRQSKKPLIFAYKYLRHPYNMVLDIQKHEELPVISTVIDNVSAMTLFTKDGKRVHRISFSVRNTWKQFMEVALPKDAQLWSAFVGGKPVKPSKNDAGKILIPLNRSQQDNRGLSAFNVELIFYQKDGNFGWFGRMEELFVVPDVMISRAIWSVYLPLNFRFIHFGGTMEKEKIARGVRPLLGLNKRIIDYTGLKQRYKAPLSSEKPAVKDNKKEMERSRAAKSILKREGNLSSDFAGDVAIGEEEVARQLLNELEFDNRIKAVQEAGSALQTGILPIRIHIPATGQLYRFAQQIISEEQPDISFVYVSDDLVLLIEIIILLLILLVLYRKRERLFQSLLSIEKWFRARKGIFEKITSPIGLIITSILLFMFAGFFFHSLVLMLLFLVLLILSIVRYIIYWWHTHKMSRTTSPKEDIGQET